MHQERQQSLSFFNIDPNAYGVHHGENAHEAPDFPSCSTGRALKTSDEARKGRIYLVDVDQVVFGINE